MRKGALIAGYYGFGNLGDELLADAVTALLGRRGVTPVLTATAGQTAPPAGTAAVNRWSLAELWKALGSVEWLILGGGGLFQDVTSAKSVLYYAGLVYLARLRGAKVAALGQSLGPLMGRAGRFLARSALRRCEVFSVRDEASRDLARSFGLKPEMQPDFVLALRPPRLERQRGLLVNFRPWKDRELVCQAARSARDYAAATNRPLLALAFSPDDQVMMEDLKARGLLPYEQLIHLSSAAPWEPWALGDCALGMRLHFGVLAFLTQTPASLVSYDPKVAGFAQAWGGKLWSQGGEAPEPWRRTPDEGALDGAFDRVLNFLDR